MTLQRKKDRAKRINVNVKINAIAYLVEVMGGLFVFSLAFLATLAPNVRTNGYVYITIQLLYGNIIPSCYLMNNSNFKSVVMKNGWIAAISKVYSKTQDPRRTPQEQQQVIPEQNCSAQNHAEDAMSAKTERILNVTAKTIICKAEITNEIQGQNQHIQETASGMDTTSSSNDAVTRHDLHMDDITLADHKNGSDNTFNGRKIKSQTLYLSESMSHCIESDKIGMSSTLTKSPMSLSNKLKVDPSVLLPNQVDYH